MITQRRVDTIVRTLNLHTFFFNYDRMIFSLVLIELTQLTKNMTGSFVANVKSKPKLAMISCGQKASLF